MDDFYNKHYIRIDMEGHIIKGFSDAFEQPQEDDILINEQGGYQFRLVPDGEENPKLYDDNGVPIYKWDGSIVEKRTAAEIQADIPALSEPELDEITQLQLAIAELYEEVLSNG